MLNGQDVWSSNNPTEDGYVYTANAAGATCGGTPHAKDSSLSLMYIRVPNTTTNIWCGRAYVEWDITGLIPLLTNKQITKIEFTCHVASTLYPRNCDITALTNKPSATGATALWNDIGNGAFGGVNTSQLNTAGTMKTVDLSIAIADLNAKIAQGATWWGFGIKFNGEARDAQNHVISIYTKDYAGANPKPTLKVTYQ